MLSINKYKSIEWKLKWQLQSYCHGTSHNTNIPWRKKWYKGKRITVCASILLWCHVYLCRWSWACLSWRLFFFRFPSTVDCSVDQMSLTLLELPPSCPQDESVEVHLQATGKLAVCNLKCQGITKVVKIHRDGDVNVCTRSQAAWRMVVNTFHSQSYI